MVTLCKAFPVERSILLRWLLAISLAKLVWFGLFIALRSEHWTNHASIGYIALQPNESLGYYHPLESLLHDGHYQGMCRMPGLLPFYLPLRAVLPEVAALQSMVVLQVVFDIFATLCLGLLAARIFQSKRAMHLTYLLACVSTFTAVRNNFLLSDSLCISIAILALFSFSSYLLHRKERYLLWAGIGLCTALFLRPIVLVVVPGVCVLLFWSEGISKQTARACLLLLLPSLLALTTWTIRNRVTYGRNVILIAPLGECQPQITPEFEAIRNWILATGGDFQPWASGGEAHWFFDPSLLEILPFDQSDYTPAYDSTDLLMLREDYHRLHANALAPQDSVALMASIIERADRCTQAYKATHPFRYYALNKVKFAGMILFPSRVDDLPFPAFAQMQAPQKAVKIWSFFLLLTVNSCSLIALLYWIWKKRIDYLLWMCLPLGLIALHSCIGFVEQRYLAISYPFMVMMLAGFAASFTKNKFV